MNWFSNEAAHSCNKRLLGSGLACRAAALQEHECELVVIHSLEAGEQLQAGRMIPTSCACQQQQPDT